MALASTSDTIKVVRAGDLKAALREAETDGAVAVSLLERTLIERDVEVPAGVTLTAHFDHCDSSFNAPGFLFSRSAVGAPVPPKRALRLGGQATIRLYGSSLSGVPIVRDTLDFTGTAVRVYQDGSTVERCGIFGFARAIYSEGVQRVRLFDNKIDCANGITVASAYDTCHIERNHLWPFLCWDFPQLGWRRSGIGMHFYGCNDWGRPFRNFVYGYQIGFRVHDCIRSGLISCGVDYLADTRPKEREGTVALQVVGDCNEFLVSDWQSTTTWQGIAVQVPRDQVVRVLASSMSGHSWAAFMAYSGSIWVDDATLVQPIPATDEVASKWGWQPIDQRYNAQQPWFEWPAGTVHWSRKSGPDLLQRCTTPGYRYSG